MTLLAPLWLIALVPWAAVTAWMLRSRFLKQKEVPFLQIWRGHEMPPPPERTRRPIKLPPIVIIAALLAMLLGIIAAADPRLGHTRTGQPTVASIVVDRGLTMTGNSRESRLKTLIAAAQGPIQQALGSGREVDLILIPGADAQRTTVNDWASAAMGASASAVQTRPQLTGAVRQRLGEARGPVIVLTDQELDVPASASARLIQIAPDKPIKDAAITGLGVSPVVSGTMQAMIKVKCLTEPAEEMTRVIVRAEGIGEIQKEIALPNKGQEKRFFIDLTPSTTRATSTTVDDSSSSDKTIVEAQLQLGDDIDADDRAFVVEERDWPRVEARIPVGPELARMIDVYAHARKGGPSRGRVLPIVADPSALAEGGGAGIVLVPSRDLQRSSGEVKVVDHPITLGIDWKRLVRDIRTATRTPADFNVVVSIGGLPAVAVREPGAESPSGPRAVWVGFESQDLGKRADFVVFWARVFEWTAQAQQSFVGRRLQALGSNWMLRTPPVGGVAVENGMWPGAYRNAEGELLALNCDGGAELRTARPEDWKSRLEAISSEEMRGTELRGPTILAACGLLLFAAAKWPRGWLAV